MLLLFAFTKAFFPSSDKVARVVFPPPAFYSLLLKTPLKASKKEKSLSHSLAHSPDSLRADSHLREARPQDYVLARRQVPSVKQEFCASVCENVY